jgi:hypothetical protein
MYLRGRKNKLKRAKSYQFDVFGMHDLLSDITITKADFEKKLRMPVNKKKCAAIHQNIIKTL